MVPPQPEVLQALLSPAVLQAHLSPAELSALRRREAAVLPDAQAACPARRHAAAVLQGFRHPEALWTEALSASAELASQLEQELWSGPVSWWALAVAWRRSAVAAAEMVRPSEVRVAGSAQRAAWARPAASSRLGEPAEPRSVEAAGACAQAVPPLVVPAYAELAPRQGAGWDVEAEPQRVVRAARSDAAAGQQRAAEAARLDGAVAPQRVAEAARSDAEAEPRRAVGAARLDAAGEQRRAAEVAELDAPAEPRQAAALWDVRGQQQAAPPSVSRRDRALPGPAPRRAVRLAHSKRRMLRAASRSKRSWQAARDEDLSC
jgi:hypothetical protein